MFLSLPLIILFAAFGDEGEPIPDYDNPYAPIFTDKSIYTWTDKIYMTIVAPSWNSDRHLIDTIGGTDTHPIKIATSDNSLAPYRFVETDANSGIFTAEVTLTGFAYDVDGDGVDDTTPRTSGTGPTNGYLEVEPDSGITISFEFADGVLLLHTVNVAWNTGIIELLHGSMDNNNNDDVFFLDDNNVDSVTVRVIDPDMNLNPQFPDTVMVHMYTDSDVVGIVARAVETTVDSGSFTAAVSLSEHLPSDGNRLYVQSGDHLYARYNDHTLPGSNVYSSDTLSIESLIRVESLSLNKLESSPVVMSNSFGEPVTVPLSVDTPFQMVGSVTNPDIVASQPFVYIFQVKASDGTIEFLSWFQSEVRPEQRIDVSQSWIPKNSGTYTIETFVWKSLDNLLPLSEPDSVLVTVN